MHEEELLAVVRQSEEAMSANARGSLMEAILNAFRERGESADDVAEGAGTTVEEMAACDKSAVRALLDYAAANAGLLKEALTEFITLRPELLTELSPALRDGITERLRAR